MMKVLIIEDAPEIVEDISIIIKMRWPDSEIISTALGEQGIDLAGSVSPSVIILGLGLPDISGFDVLRQIRLFSDIPILILTVSSGEKSIVKGLEWGADDYIVKPFKQLEFLSRIQGALRRYNTRVDKPLVYGQLRFDPKSMQVVYGTNEIQISRTEGIILGQLMRNTGAVVTYSELSDLTWGGEFSGASDSIKVHIHHLRKKLEAAPGKPKIILNKQGVGYYLANPS